MLSQLHIEDYALIDRLSLDFGPGLNLLTGETGSGKSIVVEAVDLLLGGKGSVDVVRAGRDRAMLSGLFRVPATHELRETADELGIELEKSDDAELLLRRELQASGRTRAFINDRPATVGALRALAPFLADIHGQNEQQALFEAAAQLALVDRFAATEELASQTADAWREWRRATARLADLSRDEQEKLRLADLWQFQVREIDAANPTADEDQRLTDEKQVLANSARIHAAAQSAYGSLYDAPGASTGTVTAALKALEDIARFDRALEPLCDSLRTARVNIEDVSYSLRDYLGRLDSNPQRLEQVEDRLAVLDRLKRKYGPSLTDVLAHADKVRQQLDELESSEELARQARAEMDAAAGQYRQLAGELSSQRKTAAARLEKAVAKILAELAMERTAFKVEFAASDSSDGWRPTGVDRIQFVISPNPGEPLRPVNQIASGGELSRLMLALKTAAARPSKAAEGDTARTLIFDEIDAGIGGRVAETVGRKLKALAAGHQVLCVTHLPQIASFADHHYFVEKTERGGRTVTLARRLDEGDRAAELARMLSGARITDTVLKHAREMLRASR